MEKKVFILFFLIVVISGCVSENQIENQQTTSTYQGFTIIGNSMSPTFTAGESVLIDFDYYENNSIQRGDIVAIKFKTQEKPFIKRVIAIEGDEVEIDNGVIFVNGEREELQDNFGLLDKESILTIQLERYNNTIPSNSFLVLGDNRKQSIDSEEYGFVSRDQIIGKVINTDTNK